MSRRRGHSSHESMSHHGAQWAGGCCQGGGRDFARESRGGSIHETGYSQYGGGAYSGPPHFGQGGFQERHHAGHMGAYPGGHMGHHHPGVRMGHEMGYGYGGIGRGYNDVGLNPYENWGHHSGERHDVYGRSDYGGGYGQGDVRGYGQGDVRGWGQGDVQGWGRGDIHQTREYGHYQTRGYNEPGWHEGGHHTGRGDLSDRFQGRHEHYSREGYSSGYGPDIGNLRYEGSPANLGYDPRNVNYETAYNPGTGAGYFATGAGVHGSSYSRGSYGEVTGSHSPSETGRRPYDDDFRQAGQREWYGSERDRF